MSSTHTLVRVATASSQHPERSPPSVNSEKRREKSNPLTVTHCHSLLEKNLSIFHVRETGSNSADSPSPNFGSLPSTRNIYTLMTGITGLNVMPSAWSVWNIKIDQCKRDDSTLHYHFRIIFIAIVVNIDIFFIILRGFTLRQDAPSALVPAPKACKDLKSKMSNTLHLIYYTEKTYCT